MGFRTLAAVMTFFDVLLGVIPSAAARCHRDGDEKARHDRAEQHRAKAHKRLSLSSHKVHDDIQHNRCSNRQERRNDHFADRGLGQHVNGAAIFWLSLAFHDTLDLAELATNFLHNRTSGTTNSGHGHGTKQIRKHTTDEEADHNVRVLKIKLDLQAREVVAQIFDVSRKQNQRGQSGRCDSIALGHSLGRVAYSVESVGRNADFLWHIGHFGNTASVIRYRTVSVDGDNHAGQSQHGRGGNRDAEQAAKHVRHDDANSDHENRQSR